MANFYIYAHYKTPQEMNRWFVELEEVGNTFDFPTKHCGEWFSDQEALAVEGITIFTKMSSFDHSNDVFIPLQNLSKFKNLKFLSIPTDAIDYTDIESISDNIMYLKITCPRLVKSHENGIKKNLLLFETALPNLISFDLYFPPLCFSNFNIKHYPKLQWLTTNLEIDKTAKSIKQFHDLESMHGFCLTGVHKKNLLADLNRSITALELWDVRTKSLDLSYLAEFTKLKYLRINANVDLDCYILLKCPELRELELWSAKPTNISALLDLTSLEKLSLRYIKPSEEFNDQLIEQMKAKFEFFEF